MSQGTQTTGVLIIHNDCSLLKETLESARHLVDSLVVVDGAYEWVAPFCEMNGEDPEKSTDDLLSILDASGLPYTYHTGVWRNETHKRHASLGFVKTDRVMRIDSDEIYDVDEAKLDAFWHSGKTMASLQAPLFLHDDVVTLHRATASFATAPIFLNLAHQEIETIIASLWLVLPDSEKGTKLPASFIEREHLGMFHHLSMFRTGNSAYRRSRFYNLLSMRMAKHVGLDVQQGFETDQEFTALVRKSNPVALDNMFKFHRLSAAFPQKKENQDFVEFSFTNADHERIVRQAYADTMAEQAERTREILGKPLEVFLGRSVFVDLTEQLRDGRTHLGVEMAERTSSKLVWHLDFGSSRQEIPSETGNFPDEAALRGCRRLLAEVSIHGGASHTSTLTLHVN